MYQKEKSKQLAPISSLPALFFLLSFLLFGLAFCSCSTRSDAAVTSTNNIQTYSGGKFVKTSNGYYKYKKKNGTYAKDCLANINGKTYYFSTKGYRQSGWKKIGKNYYYFGKSSEGYMYKLRWLETKDGTYLLRRDGRRAKGWVTFNRVTYYFNSNGLRASNGFQTINGNKYYFDANGVRYTGKHKINGTNYYFNSSGVLQHSGANLTLTSDCAVLVDASTGKTIYNKRGSTKHANASTTKILTCILALEQASLSDKVTVSQNAASQVPSKLGMKAGDSFKMGDLLYSLMLPSHNDTAIAIAEHVGGNTSSFVALMNKKARAIGCTSTNFVTASGLDNGLNHYTTASDLAKIARYAWKNATFRKIVGTSSYRFKSYGGTSYTVNTTNMLLGSLSGCKGMKTGYTRKAGRCFVGVIKAKNGSTYISVILGASDESTCWKESRTLLNYANTLK